MPREKKSEKKYLFLSLTALGVVYGDIGTSPLYAIRACFNGPFALPVTPAHILGVLSLIFWSLLLIISIKYLIFILRADNDGEGGILSLMALVLPAAKGWKYSLLLGLGLFGAALLYSDGVITPAISVLSAIEGLNVTTDLFRHHIIAITIIVLILLFSFQKRGTGEIGRTFGIIMIVWFLSLAVLGVYSIIKNPEILKAVNPFYGIHFLIHNGLAGFVIMGIVFLAVTGGETLYADLGHFGRMPIRLAWFSLVLPALLLNYFGQGALLLRNPADFSHPFYHLAPTWSLYPLIALATVATVIASQAIISGAFSLTFQAIQLGYLPRLPIKHTSHEERGQIYMPHVNWLLFAFTTLLVIAFKTSDNLAAAYGVAIATTMVITTLLLFFAMRHLWKWPLLTSFLVCIFFLIIDLCFFSSNILKLPEGGWVPLAIAAFIYLLMVTWRDGRDTLRRQFEKLTSPIEEFIQDLEIDKIHRVPGIAVYMTSDLDYAPPSLKLNLKHNQVLHDEVVLLSVEILKVPFIFWKDRIAIKKFPKNIFTIDVRYGYMNRIDIQALIPKFAEVENGLDFKMDMEQITFFLGRETMFPSNKVGMSVWRDRIFITLSKFSQGATRYFNLPPDRVFEIGAQIKV